MSTVIESTDTVLIGVYASLQYVVNDDLQETPNSSTKKSVKFQLGGSLVAENHNNANSECCCNPLTHPDEDCLG